MTVYLDTHVAILLHQGQKDTFPSAATAALNRAESLFLSPMAALSDSCLVTRDRLIRDNYLHACW